jgi:TRAP transporter TAXI family solute receptor
LSRHAAKKYAIQCVDFAGSGRQNGRTSHAGTLELWNPEPSALARRHLIRYGAFVAIAASLTACVSHAEPDHVERRVLRLTTGTPGGGFYPLGEALARAYRSAMPGVEIHVRESPGSVQNVDALQRGEADLGFAFAHVAYVAFVGRLESHPLDKLRGIAVLQPNPLHLVVRAGSGIRSIADLRGRRVSVGPAGSGTALTASLVLEAFGIEPASLHLEMLPFNESSERLIAGTLDAIIVDASYPSDAISRATAAGARLLPIEGPAVERLRHDFPLLRLTAIPAGTYPATPEAVHTIAADNVLLCRSDLDERLVYELTKAFFAALPTLSAEQTSLRLVDVAQLPATPVPLHDGAARYYREREIFP